ncbi:MAG: hypothetical protein H0T73_02295 [Ardenticatenales bacterium]|nr:hypothetical protein [Ardenticatenales bacterium]
MDINQNSQINWLDEELRRAKATVTEVRQRVEGQTLEIIDQSKRIQELEGRLASTQAKLGRFNVLEQTIQQVKDELVHMVREQEEEVVRHQRELSKSRQLEQESTARALNELRRSLESIPPLQERFTILKAEDQRLGEVVQNLQTRITAHERQTSQLPERLTYIEGQRAQDMKAVTQIQAEVVELLRRTENIASKHDLVDDIARKTEQRVNALSSLREELTKRQAQVMEDIRLREVLRDQQMQEWQKVLGHFEEEMGKHRKALERFGRQQDEVQQYLVGMEEYKQVLNREQQQVTQVQRLSEERQRRELEEWVAANEQRWTKSRLEQEAQWNQHHTRTEEVNSRLKQLDGWRVEDVERVQRINKELILIKEEYRAKLRELWAVWEKAAIFQLDSVRRWYDEITGTVQEKIGDR